MNIAVALIVLWETDAKNRSFQQGMIRVVKETDS